MAKPQITIIDSGLRKSNGDIIPIGVIGEVSTGLHSSLASSSPAQFNLHSLLANKDGILAEGFKPYTFDPNFPTAQPSKTEYGRGFIGLGREKIWGEKQLDLVTQNEIPVFDFRNGKWEISNINIGDISEQNKADVQLDGPIAMDPKTMPIFKQATQKVRLKTGELVSPDDPRYAAKQPKLPTTYVPRIEGVEAAAKAEAATKDALATWEDMGVGGGAGDYGDVEGGLRPQFSRTALRDTPAGIQSGIMTGSWAPESIENLMEQGYSEEEAKVLQAEQLAQAKGMFPQTFPQDMTVAEAQELDKNKETEFASQAQAAGQPVIPTAGQQDILGDTIMGPAGMGIGTDPDLESMAWQGLPTADYAGALPSSMPYSGIPLVGDVYQNVIPKYKQAYDMAQLLGIVQADPQASSGQTGTIGFQQFMQANPDVRGLLGSGLAAIDAVKQKIGQGTLPQNLSQNEQYIFHKYIKGSAGNPLGGVQQELLLRQSLTDYLPEAVRGAARAGLARMYQHQVATDPLSLFGKGQGLDAFSPWQTTDPLAFTPTPTGGAQPIPSLTDPTDPTDPTETIDTTSNIIKKIAPGAIGADKKIITGNFEAAKAEADAKLKLQQDAEQARLAAEAQAAQAQALAKAKADAMATAKAEADALIAQAKIKNAAIAAKAQAGNIFVNVDRYGGEHPETGMMQGPWVPPAALTPAPTPAPTPTPTPTPAPIFNYPIGQAGGMDPTEPSRILGAQTRYVNPYVNPNVNYGYQGGYNPAGYIPADYIEPLQTPSPFIPTQFQKATGTTGIFPNQMFKEEDIWPYLATPSYKNPIIR